jgi:hypothetical protein
MKRLDNQEAFGTFWLADEEAGLIGEFMVELFERRLGVVGRWFNVKPL